MFQQVVELDLLSKWTELIFFLLTSSHFIITVNLLADILLLCGILGVTVQAVAFIKVVQLNVYVFRLSVTNFRWRHFTFFQGQINFALTFLDDINRLYGAAIPVFLFLHCPLNGVLAVALLMGAINRHLLALAYIILTIQWAFILGIHFFCITICKRLHLPAKHFLKLFVNYRGSCFQHIKRRLKMTTYLEQFYTQNVFSVTYGRFGKITYSSFFRNVFYYFKFLLFVYKLAVKL